MATAIGNLHEEKCKWRSIIGQNTKNIRFSICDNCQPNQAVDPACDDDVDSLESKKHEDGKAKASLYIKNYTDVTILFKVKTTKPQKYFIIPSCVLLKKDEEVTISIETQEPLNIGSSVLLDKFMI